MRKSYLKNIFLIILGAIIAGTTYFGLMTQEVSAANLELSEVQDLAVGFQEEYPEAGKELHAEVTGLQANEYCTFSASCSFIFDLPLTKISSSPKVNS